MAMKVTRNRCNGRADPFGLLVIVVLMALSVTVVIQAQASSSNAPQVSPLTSAETPACLSAPADCGLRR